MKRFLLFSVLVLSVSAAQANQDRFDDEVAHLLNYIEQSDCTFIRNGTSYSAAEARAHIGRKFGHIKRRISSAEQFITYGASRSSITGTAYKVDCAGVSMESGRWLSEELEAYRKAQAGGSPPTDQQVR
jgi:hypothetical protein